MSLTTSEVRMFMRDYATAVDSGLTYVFNELLDHVEFTEGEVTLAMELAVGKYNATGHITSVDVIDNKYLMMLGTCMFLMHSGSFHQLRNQLTYNDGGEHHGYTDKYQSYQHLANALRAEWDAVVPLYKISKNMEACYGELSSAYAGFGYPALISSL